METGNDRRKSIEVTPQELERMIHGEDMTENEQEMGHKELVRDSIQGVSSKIADVRLCLGSHVWRDYVLAEHGMPAFGVARLINAVDGLFDKMMELAEIRGDKDTLLILRKRISLTEDDLNAIGQLTSKGLIINIDDTQTQC